jgi:ribosomal protein S18 acetylase RimI-like enzyme
LIEIREFAADDLAAVVGVWHRAGLDAYAFLPSWQRFSLHEAQKVFLDVIHPACDVWVGVDGGLVVAYLAMRGSYIDRLYVDPPHQRKGWGRRFIAFAKELQPRGLELHTHQQNQGARKFYERLGFVPVRFGISPAPENSPDVEYHWRP